MLLICLGGLCVTLIVCGLSCYKGRPFRSNRSYVYQRFDGQNHMSNTLFRPNRFSGFYYKDGVWHGSEHFTLAFYPQADNTVYGKGVDHLGAFVVTGVYSPRTLRMAFDKHYQADSKHPGQIMTIQIAWQPNSQQFEGKYYLKVGQHQEKQNYRALITTNTYTR